MYRKPLHKLAAGEKAFIIDINDAKQCELFFELGVFPGDLVQMEENCSGNNSLRVRINNKRFNIYKQAAETIITEVVSFELSLN